MSYQDQEFMNLELNVDPENYILVDFDVHTAPKYMDRVYREIPAESSVGTWQKVHAMTDEILKKLSAKTYHVEKVNDSFSKIKVAYPIELFEPRNIPQAFSLFAGNVYGMNTVEHLRVVDVQFPKDFIDSFPGPKFGPHGIYKILGVEQGPILGSIIKPKLGSPPDVHAQTSYETWKGGITWIKDDEPMTNQDFCPFEDRISKVLEMADRIKEEQGRQVVYAANITGTIDVMEKRADFVKDMGGKVLMIDVVTTGFSAVQHIRDLDYGLAIHAHRAMHGAITKNPLHGIHMKVLAKAYRMLGVDGIHTGTIFGKMGYGKVEEDKEEVFTSNHALLDENFGSLKQTIPIASGGVGVKNIGKIVQALAPHVVITSGGGIHGHPDGSEAGAKAITAAKDAALEGVVEPDALLQWAKDNGKVELVKALENEKA